MKRRPQKKLSDIKHGLVSHSAVSGGLLPQRSWRCVCGSRVEFDGIIVCRSQSDSVGCYEVQSLGMIADVWEAEEQRQAEARDRREQK